MTGHEVVPKFIPAQVEKAVAQPNVFGHLDIFFGVEGKGRGSGLA
jgi:hypothetical protein